ncbi:efflux RND transporter periplasmic adaptor subunit [Mucilaginibacter sp. L3T2-6]|uniref:efflux RND transporter periplasmic adaptor subunit n=1 Tax=Mucilaginibacter sp. L3T2-6 TaxID=3062491 RepID=UPI00267666AB|nr:efflux RND transporter periplasmic adaptor subunit [Mucilaginibacter sp. L3T2-6]MDO3643722.1 efflux RND transporter periplasmic adaptor subunit [Mucilaginibacter sp. L3T2-6]MDV6216173.1 efflux RND transporter periplasmic adaptor subunit [Mucilaginibacter sp. L3T2-6]
MNKIKIAIGFLALLGLAACKPKPQQQAVAKVQAKAYYTCSMHPQVHEDHPGNCPICSMKLIKVEITGTDAMNSNKIVLTATQIRLAGIQTDTVCDENTGVEKTLTGTVTTDESKTDELSARVAGRIQQLFVRTVGEKVSIGQPVYTIYSEDLQEAEKEYLLARQQQKILHNPDVDYGQLTSSAENKLLLWGLSPEQIRNLAQSGKVSATVTVLSKIAGTVSDIAIHEGDYVTEGITVLKTQALNTLWIEAQLYASEAGNYHVNDKVNVSLPDLSGQIVAGKVEFINPELSGQSKVDLVRIRISNPQGLIRPGMHAYISIGSEGKRSLAVPASAVLVDGKGSLVWVKNADGSFSPKMVSIGSGNQNYVPVISGLNKGDVVVTSGAYLMNSEAIFKNGSDNMAGMKM